MKKTADLQHEFSSNPSRRNRAWPAWLMAAPMLLLLVLPLLTLLGRTRPGIVAHYLRDSQTLQAIGLSLATSAATVALTMSFGTPLAYLLARKPLRGRPMWDVIIDLPTVLPPAVAGVALFTAFGRRGALGPALHAMGIEIPFTPMAVVLAQTFVAAPYFIKAAALGIAGIDSQLVEAATLDGATARQVFLDITLPLAWRAMMAGAALCWARALGEFGATIIFAGNYPGRTRTMPIAVYMGFEIDFDQALTLAAILLAVSFAVLLTVRKALRSTIRS